MLGFEVEGKKIILEADWRLEVVAADIGGWVGRLSRVAAVTGVA